MENIVEIQASVSACFAIISTKSPKITLGCVEPGRIEPDRRRAYGQGSQVQIDSVCTRISQVNVIGVAIRVARSGSEKDGVSKVQLFQ
jgi:hypothetical protein